MVVDLFLVYQFIRRLATPFEKWEAHKLGIIDKDGKVLIKRKNFSTAQQRKAWGVYDIMIANIKKLMSKIPGGGSKLASYAAALFLIKEYKAFTDESMLNEELSDEQLDESMELFFSRYNYYTKLSEDVNQNLHESVKKVRWKRAGADGEIQATIGGKKYQIEKSLDHNERHKGEWKVMVWDKRRESWEWETTEYGKANAKAWIADRLEEEPVAANNVGSGNIAGMDGGHMSKAGQKKWTSSNKSKKMKRLRDIIGDKIQ